MQITIWISFKYIILLLVFICTICSFCLFSAFFWIEYFSEFNFIFTIDLLAIHHIFRSYSELHWIICILTYSQLSNNVIQHIIYESHSSILSFLSPILDAFVALSFISVYVLIIYCYYFCLNQLSFKEINKWEIELSIYQHIYYFWHSLFLCEDPDVHLVSFFFLPEEYPFMFLMVQVMQWFSFYFSKKAFIFPSF